MYSSGRLEKSKKLLGSGYVLDCVNVKVPLVTEQLASPCPPLSVHVPVTFPPLNLPAFEVPVTVSPFRVRVFPAGVPEFTVKVTVPVTMLEESVVKVAVPLAVWPD